MRDIAVIAVANLPFISFQKRAIMSCTIIKDTEMSILLISVFSYRFLIKSAMSARRLRSTGTKT